MDDEDLKRLLTKLPQKTLTHLELNGVKLTSCRAFDTLTFHPQLRILSLEGMGIEPHESSQAMGALGRFAQLEQLNLSATVHIITLAQQKHFPIFTRLQVLKLNDVTMSNGLLMHRVTQMKMLTHLEVRNTAVTHGAILALRDMPALTCVDVTGTQVERRSLFRLPERMKVHIDETAKVS
jgi:hypothetical protein